MPVAAEAGVTEAEQQEGVGAVAQGEEAHGQEEPPQLRGEGSPAQRRRGRHRGGGPRRLGHAEDEDRHHPQGGHRGEEEHGAQVDPRDGQQRHGHQRPGHGSGVVHGALQPEGGAVALGRGDVGNEGVARRSAQPLAHSVGDPQGATAGQASRQADQGPGQARYPVPRHDQGLAPPRPVGEPSRAHLQQGRRRLGGALDHPQGHGAGRQGLHQEEGQERVDHLAGQVGQQAHQAQRHHRRREARPGARAGVGHRASSRASGRLVMIPSRPAAEQAPGLGRVVHRPGEQLDPGPVGRLRGCRRRPGRPGRRREAARRRGRRRPTHRTASPAVRLPPATPWPVRGPAPAPG